jgi:hypothetical protein
MTKKQFDLLPAVVLREDRRRALRRRRRQHQRREVRDEHEDAGTG